MAGDFLSCSFLMFCRYSHSVFVFSFYVVYLIQINLLISGPAFTSPCNFVPL